MISFDEPDKTWQQYGLLQYPVIFRGEETSYKVIVRYGDLVKILGKGYELFPNEEALKLANQAAEMAGLKPFHISAPGMRTEDNAIYNDEMTKMRAMYNIGKVENGSLRHALSHYIPLLSLSRVQVRSP